MDALLRSNTDDEPLAEKTKPALQAALIASEMRYRRLFESAKDGILILDATSGKILEVNPYLIDLLGYSEEQFIGKEIWEIGFLKDITANKDKFAELQLKKYVRYDDLPLQTAKGRKINVEFVSNVYTEGSSTIIQCNIRDITDRRKAEKALTASENRYRRLFEASKDGILLLNAETGMIIDVNPFLIGLLGYSKDQFIEKTIWEIGFFKDIVANQDKFVELQQQEYVRYENLPLETADGRKISVEFVSNVYSEEHRSVIQCNIRDITSRKVAEADIKHKNEQLVKINTEKDKFFSIIAHDLRSPFNGFLNLTRIMAEDLPDMTQFEIQKFALSMRNSANNLFSLLENLLDWSQMQQGLTPFNPQVVQLLPVINDAFTLMYEPARIKGIELSCYISPNTEVFAVSNMLQSVIRNLVSNAIKFTPTGGSVTVSADRLADHTVMVAVKDTGIGMNREMVENLFRLDVNPSRKGTEGEASTGLGLILCKDFIENQGGEIQVESEEGIGSTFRFTIPVFAS